MVTGERLAVISEARLPGDDFLRLPTVEVVTNLAAFAPTRPDVGGLIVVHQRVDRNLLEKLPSLRVVSRYGIGYDTIDVQACTERGIQVGITPGPVEAATAELTIGLIMCARWNLLGLDAAVRQGRWSDPIEVLPAIEGLAGSKLGLVGFGRVGREVAKRASALGMTLYYHARHPSEAAHEFGAVSLPLDELIASVDVVSIHVPLSTETAGLIDARRLALMRSGATLVNTARGGIVDEQALIAALHAGRITAALDVFDDEPLVPLALRGLPNVVLTPHVGSATTKTRIAMTRLVVDNVLAGLCGRAIPYPVDEQRPNESPLIDGA